MMLAPIVSQLEADSISGRALPKVVSVSGAVRAPGIYPLAQTPTSATSFEAGGAVSTAYVDAAEVRSINLTRGQEVVSYRRVNLGTAQGQAEACRVS